MTALHVADFVTSEITTAKALCNGNARSPQKAQKLLNEFRRRGGYEACLAWWEENDTALFLAARIVREHCAGNKFEESKTWQDVLQNLSEFAKQEGRWELTDSNLIFNAMSEVRASSEEKFARQHPDQFDREGVNN